MKEASKLTYVLLALLILVSTAVAFSRTNKIPSSGTTQSRQDLAKWSARQEETEKQFPTAEFNEAEPTEPLRRAQLQQKQKRKGQVALVARDPWPNSGGASFLPENQFDFPGLPVGQCPVILIGDVLRAEAHLSEDKRAVFSEFTIRVIDVIKAETSLPGSEMIVERPGGYVHYPDGRKLLYRVGTGGMPRVGARYLFFLNQNPDIDYSILTAYEFGDKGVVALDPSAQFEKYEEYAPDALRNLVIETLNKSRQPSPQ